MRMSSALAAAAVAALTGCASGPPLPPLEVVAVHEAKGTKQQLCTAARDWAALTFKDSKAVVEVFDAEQGKLIGKGRIRLASITEIFPADFTMVVECRDGRVRASYSRVQPYSKGSPFPLVETSLLPLRSQAETEIKRIDADLGAYLLNPKLGGQW
jgi:hypothetical protein